MSTQPAAIVQRLWNYCNVLRDDGVSRGDYVDQRRWQAVLKRAFEGRLVARIRRVSGSQGRIATRPPVYYNVLIRNQRTMTYESSLPETTNHRGVV